MKFNGNCSESDDTGFIFREKKFYIEFGIKLWPFSFDNGFTLTNSLFGGATLTANFDPDKYSYYGYVTSVNVPGPFSLSNCSFSKKVVVFDGNMNSSVHVDNIYIYIYILILGISPTQGLDDTTLTEESKFSINFTKSGKKCIH